MNEHLMLAFFLPLAACGAASTLKAVDNVHAYDKDLAGCLALDSGAEYTKCADEADAKHGRVGAKDGGAR